MVRLFRLFFLSFSIQTPSDTLFSTKLLMGASIEKKRKTIREGGCSRFLNCWTLIKKTNESPVPIDFLSFYIQIPCDILFSTKLLMGASIEKKRKQCKQVSALAFLIVGLVLDAEKDNIK
jgi:hypothetical protein